MELEELRRRSHPLRPGKLAAATGVLAVLALSWHHTGMSLVELAQGSRNMVEYLRGNPEIPDSGFFPPALSGRMLERYALAMLETGELLAEIGEDALRELLGLLPDETEIVTAPREGALLLTFREGLGERFHLGEALASTCRVRCRGQEGWGAVLGGDPRRALVAATLDALERSEDRSPELAAARTVLDRERARVMSARHRTAALAASTRVEFDLLPGA